VGHFLEKYPDINGWRKIKNWRFELKGLMREVGKVSKSGGKNKEEKLRTVTTLYLDKSRLLQIKLKAEKIFFPIHDEIDLGRLYTLEYYMCLADKHIDLVERRILKGEIIPHEEKTMSIFEEYTEWIVKGKFYPFVELGKILSITTDQYHLILLHKVLNGQRDKDIVIEVADKLLHKYKLIASMSFDKGHWNKENKALLELEIPRVILPKLGKLTAEEKELEKSKPFKQLKNKHSAIESNINELEHRGLDHCPDRNYFHFCTYIAMGVCAYNLKKIGKKILENQLNELRSKEAA